MSELVLSLFPGLGVLDMGFEAEGWCVVKGPDAIWGGDIRTFHPPHHRFDGVIGGDPCQSHSRLVNLVRAKGLEPSFPDMTGEFARVIEEARPLWFLRENVPGAPDIKPEFYEVTSFLLCNSWLGEEQMRKRRFWFGWWHKRGPAPNLRRWIPGVALELPDQALTVDAGHDKLDFRPRVQSPREGSQARYTLEEMLELQGLPPDLFAHSPLTMEGKRKLVGNAVALPVARAIAQAVRKALE